MKILILPKDKFPLNRPMLTELWSKEMIKLGCDLYWIVQSQKINGRILKKILPSNSLYIIPAFGKKQLVLKIINIFLNIFFKLFLSMILINQYKIRLIHVHNAPEEGIIALILSKIFKIGFTYAYTSHFLFSINLPIKDRNRLETLFKNAQNYIRKRLYLTVLKNASVVFPISEELMIILNSEFEVPINKMMAVPECASSLFLEQRKKSDVKVLNKPKKLVYIGSLGKRRKIDFIVDMFGIVKTQYNNIELYLIGWGERSNDIKLLNQYINKKKLESSIKFLNKIPYNKVPEELFKFDIGLSLIPPLGIYLISTPTKCIEYLSLGLPVVANSEIKDQKKLLDLSGGGILTKYDIHEAANSVMKLLLDEELRTKCGEQGYKWIKENRTFSNIATPIYFRLSNIKKGYKKG